LTFDEAFEKLNGKSFDARRAEVAAALGRLTQELNGLCNELGAVARSDDEAVASEARELSEDCSLFIQEIIAAAEGRLV
jgi:hypothetical protein